MTLGTSEHVLMAKDKSLPWESYEGRNVCITGATGLIGQAMVRTLLAHESAVPTGMRVCALVRNTEKALRLFGNHDALSVRKWDAERPQEGLGDLVSVDYVFHCANMTDSASFIERPVEVIRTTVGGASAMLELTNRTGATLCLLSTMETYGEVATDAPLNEDQGGFLDPMVVRNCYPEAKRLDEALVAAYSAEYGVRSVVVRLTQTFGPGVRQDDNRVFAYFARCAQAGEDIVMLTEGTKKNAYLYTMDAVSALLFAAARGETGRAYNAANDDTFCEVREMAQLVANNFGNGRTKVRFAIDEQAASRFRKGSKLFLDTSALRDLGWTPKVGLAEMYERMMAGWNDER